MENEGAAHCYRNGNMQNHAWNFSPAMQCYIVGVKIIQLVAGIFLAVTILCRVQLDKRYLEPLIGYLKDQERNV